MGEQHAYHEHMGHEDQTVVVPSLVGLLAANAHDKALDAHLLAVDQDPSHTPSVAGVVTAQEPLPGKQLAVGHRVKIWVDTEPDTGGGGRGGNQPVSTGPTPVAPGGTK